MTQLRVSSRYRLRVAWRREQARWRGLRVDTARQGAAAASSAWAVRGRGLQPAACPRGREQAAATARCRGRTLVVLGGSVPSGVWEWGETSCRPAVHRPCLLYYSSVHGCVGVGGGGGGSRGRPARSRAKWWRGQTAGSSVAASSLCCAMADIVDAQLHTHTRAHTGRSTHLWSWRQRARSRRRRRGKWSRIQPHTHNFPSPPPDWPRFHHVSARCCCGGGGGGGARHRPTRACQRAACQRLSEHRLPRTRLRHVRWCVSVRTCSTQCDMWGLLSRAPRGPPPAACPARAFPQLAV